MSILKESEEVPEVKAKLSEFLSRIEQKQVFVPDFEPLLDLEQYRANFKGTIPTETSSEAAYLLYEQ